MTDETSFEAGNVVMLKSGGQALTVVSTTPHGVQCIWIGEEGDLFSATLPAIALEACDMDFEETEDEGEESESSEQEETETERAA
jgi:uncharacterized protein YodC (DUF2158 family)